MIIIVDKSIYYTQLNMQMCYGIVVNAYLSGCSKEWEVTTYASFDSIIYVYAFAQGHIQLALPTGL